MRLYDRKGWTIIQITFTVIRKLLGLLVIVLISFSPLKIGSIDFIIGTTFFTFGLVLLTIAIMNYKNSPLDKPITKGFYKVSRNPQLLSLWVIFIGMSVAVGSWINIFIILIAIGCAHFGILGEERRLTEQYGDSYLEYKKKVPRYFLFF